MTDELESKRRTAPTLVDVARAAGVSHQTVSRVINSSDAVSPETRAKVSEAIDRMGYRRNLGGWLLSSARTRTLGVLAPALIEYGPTRTVQSVESAAAARGYRAVIATYASGAGTLADALNHLIGYSVEGLLIVASTTETRRTLATLPSTLPVITVGRLGFHHELSIAIDQALGARLAVEHVADMGHRNIQYLAGPPDYVDAQERQRSVCAAVGSRGLAMGPLLRGDWSAQSGYRVAEQVHPATTAVICGNDQMALGLLAALPAAGRRVPHDVSVIGFDDVPESAYFRPALTTVRQDFGALGRAAVATILEVIGGGQPSSRLITPSLTERASTARAKVHTGATITVAAR
ncbi:LacI family DNA-binding transcriptional regulator [soil metagenome]